MSMAREEYDNLGISGTFACPDCGSKQTHPTPNCSCSFVEVAGGFGYTNHINKYHHTCQDNQ